MAFQTTSLPVTLFNLPSPPGPHSLSLSPSTSSALSTAFSIRRTFGHSARPSSGVLSNVDVNILRSFSIQSSEPGLIRQAEREEGEQGQQLPEEYRRTSSRRLAQVPVLFFFLIGDAGLLILRIVEPFVSWDRTFPSADAFGGIEPLCEPLWCINSAKPIESPFAPRLTPQP